MKTSPDGPEAAIGVPSSTRAIIATITVMAALAGMPSEALACTLPDDFARLASPEAEIAYRWEPAELKVGRFFAAEVIACRAPGAEPVRTIVLDAQMPAHGHGMNYRPAVDADGPGPLPLHGADAAHARHLAAHVRPVPGRQAHAPHARRSP